MMMGSIMTEIAAAAAKPYAVCACSAFSFNRGCGINQIASVFTNVLAYFDWLLREASSQPSSCIKNQPFICPSDTGSYPIWPSACTSQHYVCIGGVPVLDVKF
jgi:hypothetical protein